MSDQDNRQPDDRASEWIDGMSEFEWDPEPKPRGKIDLSIASWWIPVSIGLSTAIITALVLVVIT